MGEKGNLKRTEKNVKQMVKGKGGRNLKKKKFKRKRGSKRNRRKLKKLKRKIKILKRKIKKLKISF